MSRGYHERNWPRLEIQEIRHHARPLGKALLHLRMKLIIGKKYVQLTYIQRLGPPNIHMNLNTHLSVFEMLMQKSKCQSR